MAATADIVTEKRNLGQKHKFPVAASATVYAGTMVMIDSAGYARAATATAVPANHGVQGVATQQVVNSGSAGALSVEVEEGEFKFIGSSLAQARVGENVFATADDTVAATGSGRPQVGMLTEYVSSSVGWVLIKTGYKAPG